MVLKPPILVDMSKRMKVASDNYCTAIDEYVKKMFILQCSHAFCRSNNGGFDRIVTGGFNFCSTRSHAEFSRICCSVIGCCAILSIGIGHLDMLRNHFVEYHSDLLSNKIEELDAMTEKDSKILELEEVIVSAKMKINKLSDRWRTRHSTEALRLSNIIDMAPALAAGLKQSILNDSDSRPRGVVY